MPGAAISHPAVTSHDGAAAAPHRPRNRVFVSYAHQDAVRRGDYEFGLIQRFYVELSNIRGYLYSRGLDLHDDEVFFDRKDLPRTKRWPDAIRRALEECELLIFLVSPDSMDSNYCIDDEVEPVIRRGNVPVVPVLIRHSRFWESRVLAGQTKLGDQHSGGVPKANATGVKPAPLAIDLWENEGLAWGAVADELASIMLETLGGHAAQATGSRHAPASSRDHLPSLCNQDQQARLFYTEAERWRRQPQRQALLTIVQGGCDDAVEGYTHRLWRTELQSSLAKLGWLTPEKIERMHWPRGAGAAERFAGIDMALALFTALDPALPGHLDDCADLTAAAKALAAHLAARKTAVVLRANIDRYDAATISQLNGLIHLLRECSRVKVDELGTRPNMSSLAFLLHDETAAPPRAYKWQQRLDPALRDAPVFLLVVPPLMPLSRKDLRDWYGEHDAARQLDLNLQSCLSWYDSTTSGIGFAWRRWQHGLIHLHTMSIREAAERCPLLRARKFTEAVRCRFAPAAAGSGEPTMS